MECSDYEITGNKLTLKFSRVIFFLTWSNAGHCSFSQQESYTDTEVFPKDNL